MDMIEKVRISDKNIFPTQTSGDNPIKEI